MLSATVAPSGSTRRSTGSSFEPIGGRQHLHADLLPGLRLEAEPVHVAGLVDGAHDGHRQSDLLTCLRRIVRLRLADGGEAIDEERLPRLLSPASFFTRML